MVVVTVILFIVLLLVLVLVHEWGHFIAAKKAGCNVEEFGFGFPPRLFSKMWHGTRYSFNLLPIGGFVKIEGENMDEEEPKPTSFASKSIPWRLTILAAGVFMNVVLAFVLLTIQSAIGTPTLAKADNVGQLADTYTIITQVSPDSPAAQAGVGEFDRILAIDTVQNPSVSEVQQITHDHAGKDLVLTFEHQGQAVSKTVVPRVNPPANEGALGIGLNTAGLHKAPLWQAPWEGLKRTGIMLAVIVQQFGLLLHTLIVDQKVSAELTGPIGIALYTDQVSKMGTSYFLEFAAMISLNLALINILPIPALDGGRILFVLLEALFRKRVSGRIESWAHTTGFVLLIALMILITLKDIRHYF